MHAAQTETVDQILDERQMVIDLAGAERDPAPPRDTAEQFEQPPIARPVNPGGPRNRDLDPET